MIATWTSLKWCVAKLQAQTKRLGLSVLIGNLLYFFLLASFLSRKDDLHVMYWRVDLECQPFFEQDRQATEKVVLD